MRYKKVAQNRPSHIQKTCFFECLRSLVALLETQPTLETNSIIPPNIRTHIFSVSDDSSCTNDGHQIQTIQIRVVPHDETESPDKVCANVEIALVRGGIKAYDISFKAGHQLFYQLLTAALFDADGETYEVYYSHQLAPDSSAPWLASFAERAKDFFGGKTINWQKPFTNQKKSWISSLIFHHFRFEHGCS